MRGKQSKWRGIWNEDGITPAHAGKTLLWSPLWRPHGDHPRACGENPMIIAATCAVSGSPPRMRGKLDLANYLQPDDGITPAHAGKTTPQST